MAAARTRGRSSTRPTVPLETAGMASSVPAPISTPTRPSATATWRRSCAASRPQKHTRPRTTCAGPATLLLEAVSPTPSERFRLLTGLEGPGGWHGHRSIRVRSVSCSASVGLPVVLVAQGRKLRQGDLGPLVSGQVASSPTVILYACGKHNRPLLPGGGLRAGSPRLLPSSHPVPSPRASLGPLQLFLWLLIGGACEDGFLAIKLTALGRPQFLLQFSDVLTKWRRFFHEMAVEQGQAGLAAMDTKLEVAALQESIAKMGIASRAEIEGWFRAETLGVSGTVDLLDWSGLVDSRTKLSQHLVVPNTQTGQLEPLLSRFTEEEELQMTRMLQRMDILARRAREVGVRLMVDAEQTYFQPAIGRLTLEMQRKFNVERPLVFGTYQCYLKDAYDNVTLDVELARREGWCFGAKLVRGAYMAQERARAAEIGYEDPINPTYEATNAMYHRCLDYVLEELKHSAKAVVMVASHNEDSVRFTLCRMEELGLHPADRQVYFGQLLGMCDHISFPLGGLPRVQVCALWPRDGGAALLVSPRPGEQQPHEGRPAGAAAAVAGAQAAAPHREPLPPPSLVPTAAPLPLASMHPGCGLPRPSCPAGTWEWGLGGP
ncbi:PREDICTED: proline dehydrogenase 1, mitochondrial isoform X2 [Propithecus coquereli]|uniref:proline dehydrogenase 1, mitochondrial isoform X2 n=1 Tax=Propithecus coquereli TaxID=379532 RepID=UPI00063EF7B2|nr:PREDICTED: proline dehydrogenase 1, mitochondrial isoform X2 [Propithecus coquereli]